MAKILCVLYDDPVDGYPSSYARDDIPTLKRYPDGQTCPRREVSTSTPASSWAVFLESSACADSWKGRLIR
jgi:formate dehydrogenase